MTSDSRLFDSLLLAAAGRLAIVVAVSLIAGTPAPAAGSNEATCRDCHARIAATLDSTPHRIDRMPKPAGTTEREACETCHGDGTNHLRSGERGAIRVPRGRDGAATCLECHATSRTHSTFASGPHFGATVVCFDCHSVHAGQRAVFALLRKDADDLCAECHAAERASFRKPFSHRLGRPGLQCISCHDPHLGRGRGNLRRSDSGDARCLGCHTEKSGPFVYEHVTGSAGDCLSCHEAHGSSNPRRLRRATVDRVCLECHSNPVASTLGSRPPSSHDIRSPRFRNCTACHVAIHGSNSSSMLLK